MVGNGSRQITYSLEIRNQVQKKCRARRAWYSIRYSTDKIEWNRVCIMLHDKIKEMKNETLKSYLSDLSATDKTGYS
jgi:hypothetical protein